MHSDKPSIIVNHVGFPVEGAKQAVFSVTDTSEFELQDMMQNDAEAPLGAFENWRTVFRGRLEKVPDSMGNFCVGDFSAWKTPGMYRLVLPQGRGRSFIFGIFDGVLGDLPRLFLDYIHSIRYGAFEDGRRGVCHLDDGIFSESGKQIDVSGGWHDAGGIPQMDGALHSAGPGLLALEKARTILWNPLGRKSVAGRLAC